MEKSEWDQIHPRIRSGRVTHSAPKCGSGRVELIAGRVGSGSINMTHIQLWDKYNWLQQVCLIGQIPIFVDNETCSREDTDALTFFKNIFNFFN